MFELKRNVILYDPERDAYLLIDSVDDNRVTFADGNTMSRWELNMLIHFGKIKIHKY
jgi:hypothetical protein